MLKRVCCLIMAGALALSAATQVSLTGTVKDGDGAVVAGAIVSLVKQTTLKDTTDAQGAFTVSGDLVGVSVPYAISVHQQSQISGSGKFVQFTIGQAASEAGISFYTGSGRRVAELSLGKLSAGRHNIAVPTLAPGCYLMHVTIDQTTVTNRLLTTGNAIYLSNSGSAPAAAGTLDKTAAAAVDELVVTKTGFTTAKVALDSYTKTNIAVVLQKEETKACVAANLPASSALTTVNEKLPDPFTFFDGTKLTKKSQWECRRQEILAMAQKYVYGPCPPKPDEVTGTVGSDGTISINCKQGSKTATFSAKISGSGDAICFKLQGGIYPSSAKTLTFGSGNASKIQTLYGVTGMIENLANAWMIDRVMDVLELNPNCGHDPKKMMVSGCSGCGKGAFLAGVFSRIPLTVIVESGGGGAANFRQAEWFRHGAGKATYDCLDGGAQKPPQSIDNLEDDGICGPWVSSVAQWLRSSPAKVKNLPFDQHLLLAAVAPRYLCHVTNQHGKGEWCHLGGTCEALSAWAAKPVFKALGVPENMGFIVYTEGSAPMHCSNPSSATTLANAFFERVFKGNANAKTDVWTANDKDLQQPVGEWKAMWVDWNMETVLE